MILYWSNRQISPSLTNTASIKVARTFGRDVLGTGNFNVNDGTLTTKDKAAPTDPAVKVPGIVVPGDIVNGKAAKKSKAVTLDFYVHPSQQRTVPNPDAIADPSNPESGDGPIGKFASHSAIGEDASPSTSEFGAITDEPVSTVRIAVETMQAAHPDLSYRAARNLYLAALESAASKQATIERRRAAKAARQRRARSKTTNNA